MKVFVVYPNAHAGWELLREGDASSLHFLAKDAAIGYARSLAAANRPSALKVETAFGQVETGWIFDGTGVARPIPTRRF
jgi:hypothetical protein